MGESWGARLRLTESQDISTYFKAVNFALENGIELQELDISFANALLDLELVNNPDYPYTPATAHEVPTLESTCGLWRPEARIYGAMDKDVLVGAIATSQKSEAVEIDFASVLSEYRGKGIGKALLAAAILAWTELGVRTFTTGGAAVNAGSIGTVRSLGFSIEEIWRSYQIAE